MASKQEQQMNEEVGGYSFSEGQISALNAQSLFLPIFRTEPEKRSFGRKGSLRLTIPEIVWIVIMMVVMFFVALGVLWFPALLLPQLINAWLYAFLIAPVAGWKIGRKLAGASPYRQQTNENMLQFLRVKSRKLSWIPSFLFNRPVVSNTYATHFKTGAMSTTSGIYFVDCVEWIGTMRAPYAPHYDAQVESERSAIAKQEWTNNVFFLPQTYPVY